MNIIIDISGNLTGFTRFYMSPGGSPIVEAFNFDYRNEMRTIPRMESQGSEAYALAYSRDYIATSLIVPTLDAFRRWGIIAVTVAIPRGFQVVSKDGRSGSAALYDLLHQLYDRLAQNCIKAGRLTDSLSLLGQDYYADILANFTLVKVRRNPGINLSVDPKPMNRGVAYVKSTSSGIPKYLETPQRASYSGIPIIVISSDEIRQEPGIKIIDEPAEEPVLYRVRIANNGRTCTLKPTEKIPQIPHASYQKPLPTQNFTLGDVMDGKADGIIAHETGVDRIELSYNFEPVKKTLTLKFLEGGNPVDSRVLNPEVVNLGDPTQKKPVVNGKVTFTGEEVEAGWRVMALNPSYKVLGNNKLYPDSKRANDEVKFSLQFGFQVPKSFYGRLPKEAEITFTRIGHNDTCELSARQAQPFLPGYEDEWRATIVCEGYQNWEGAVTGTPELKKASKNAGAIGQGRNGYGKGVEIGPGAPGDTKEDRGFNKRKWIILGGLALVAIVVGVFLIYYFKNKEDKNAEVVTQKVNFNVVVLDDQAQPIPIGDCIIELKDQPENVVFEEAAAQIRIEDGNPYADTPEMYASYTISYPEGFDKDTQLTFVIKNVETTPLLFNEEIQRSFSQFVDTNSEPVVFRVNAMKASRAKTEPIEELGGEPKENNGLAKAEPVQTGADKNQGKDAKKDEAEAKAKKEQKRIEKLAQMEPANMTIDQLNEAYELAKQGKITTGKQYLAYSQVLKAMRDWQTIEAAYNGLSGSDKAIVRRYRSITNKSWPSKPKTLTEAAALMENME